MTTFVDFCRAAAKYWLRHFVLLLAAVLCHPAGAVEGDTLPVLTPAYAWILPAVPGELRWVNLKEPRQNSADGILHIEVLARAPRGKPWAFKRLAAHMAITEQALLASVVKAGSYGGVYPESYYEARKRWDALAAEGKAPVCTTTLLGCLKSVR